MLLVGRCYLETCQASESRRQADPATSRADPDPQLACLSSLALLAPLPPSALHTRSTLPSIPAQSRLDQVSSHLVPSSSPAPARDDTSMAPTIVVHWCGLPLRKRSLRLSLTVKDPQAGRQSCSAHPVAPRGGAYPAPLVFVQTLARKAHPRVSCSCRSSASPTKVRFVASTSRQDERNGTDRLAPALLPLTFPSGRRTLLLAVKRYTRSTVTNLAPPELREVHPLGKVS